MNATVTDGLGQVAATLLDVPLLVLPGFALAAAGDLLGFRAASPGRKWLLAVFAGLVLLPLIDSLVIRVVGLPPALVVNGALALGGLVAASRDVSRWRFDAGVALVGAIWFVLVLYSWIDLDVGGGLHQSFVAGDLVKHAATTAAIADHGVPPIDPFFARAGRAGYYYFFYTLPALTTWLAGPLADARAAYSGALVWTGVGLVALLGELLARSGLVAGEPTDRVRRLHLAVLGVAGLDVVPALWRGLTDGAWLPVPEWWNEQVTWWVSSLLWVPHHVSGLLAAWLAFLLLADAQARPDRALRATLVAVLAAGAALAACAGLSIWLAFGAAVTGATWFAILAVERKWRAVVLLGAAGLIGILLALPDILDLLASRTDANGTIALTVRRFSLVQGLTDDRTITLALRFVLLPLNYFLEFGLFAVGTILFWRLFPTAEFNRTEVGRLLTISAAVALGLASFLQSVIINNDLGWRVILFAQLTATVWTVAAVARLRSGRDTRMERRGSVLTRPAALAVAAALGLATTVYGLFWLRAFVTLGPPHAVFFNRRPDVDLAKRHAYEWAARSLSHDTVLQANPGARRVFDFGLYGRNRTGVADGEAMLFGASATAVTARLDSVEPMFVAAQPAAAIRHGATAAGIDALVVSAEDPVWADRASWVWTTPTLYADPLVRIVAVHDL